MISAKQRNITSPLHSSAMSLNKSGFIRPSECISFLVVEAWHRETCPDEAPFHSKATLGSGLRLINTRQWSASQLSRLPASQEADGLSGLAHQLLSQDIFRVALFLSEYCAERLTPELVWMVAHLFHHRPEQPYQREEAVR